MKYLMKDRRTTLVKANLVKYYIHMTKFVYFHILSAINYIICDILQSYRK